jgi:glutaredoxin-like protein
VIPLRDQDFLRQRFAAELNNRLRVDFFTQRPSPIIVPGRQECAYCDDVRTVLEELAALSNRIAFSVHDIEAEKPLAVELGIDKVPGIVLRGPMNRPVRFFGFPSGAQFPNFVEVMLDVGRGTVELPPDVLRQIRRLKTDVRLQVMVTTTDPHGPPAVRAAVRLALQSVRVKTDIIEIAEFPHLGQKYNVNAVPTTLIGESLLVPGQMDEAALVQHILRVAEGKPIAREITPGPATAIDPAMFQPQQAQQQRPTTTASGLILPR